MQNSVYVRIGAALLLAGGLAAPVFYVVAQSVPLTALALAAVMLGATSLLLGRSLPRIPPQVAEVLLHTGLENVARLLEEIGLDAKAIYLPSRLGGGKPRAMIPLDGENPRPAALRPVQDRLIVDFGPRPEDVGILVATPGTAIADISPASPAGTSAELEASLARILVGTLDIATKVAVARENGGVRVTIEGLRLTHPDLWIYRSLGTPPASIAATLVAEGLDRPVTIRSEDRRGDRMSIWLDVEE